MFAAGEYDDDKTGNSTFATGDWNGDKDFDSSDLVAAFREGSYSNAAVAAAVDSIFEGDTGERAGITSRKGNSRETLW